MVVSCGDVRQYEEMKNEKFENLDNSRWLNAARSIQKK